MVNTVELSSSYAMLAENAPAKRSNQAAFHLAFIDPIRRSDLPP